MDVINTTGRRKTAIVSIYLSDGQGNIVVNKRPIEDYFPSEVLRMLIHQPLELTEVANQYNIKINVKGGGLKGQAEAIRLAVSRALCKLNPDHRPILKKEGYLTRDPRMVERKKYGRRKARRRFQFSKR
ncbi:MAG: 30S ribosomal protein S9 [Bacteroidota bacterium]